MRKGNFIQTRTGQQFYSEDPRAEEVRIEDIAHSLGNICRFNGHVRRFYSVAEHSVYVSYAVPEEYALYGLLHDAHEAYTADMASPLKVNIPWFKKVQKRLDEVIFPVFGLDAGYNDTEVHWADSAMCATEEWQLMRSAYIAHERIDVHIHCFPPEVAKEFFMNRFKELTEGFVYDTY